MTRERVKVVVWDSIGNTLLGVRPWRSWDAPTQETLLRENPAAQSAPFLCASSSANTISI